jgi:hypothetical protein
MQEVTAGIVGLGNVSGAVEEMSRLDFLKEPPLALPMETAL